MRNGPSVAFAPCGELAPLRDHLVQRRLGEGIGRCPVLSGEPRVAERGEDLVGQALLGGDLAAGDRSVDLLEGRLRRRGRWRRGGGVGVAGDGVTGFFFLHFFAAAAARFFDFLHFFFFAACAEASDETGVPPKTGAEKTSSTSANTDATIPVHTLSKLQVAMRAG